MYGDPLDVAIRKELKEQREAMKRAAREREKQWNRARIQALYALAIREASKP